MLSYLSFRHVASLLAFTAVVFTSSHASGPQRDGADIPSDEIVYHAYKDTEYHVKGCPRLWGDLDWDMYTKMTKAEAEEVGLRALCPFCPGSTQKKPKVPYVVSWNLGRVKAACEVGISDYEPPAWAPLISMDDEGKLIYNPYSEKGDKLSDFSQCGYRRSDVPLPEVPVVLTLTPPEEAAKTVEPLAYPVGTDSRETIQSAIEEVAAMEPDADGLRGAVLLKKGTWHIHDKGLLIYPGVVLRGEGDGEDGTVLIFHNCRDKTGISLGGTGETKYVEAVSGVLRREKGGEGKDRFVLVHESGQSIPVFKPRFKHDYDMNDFVDEVVTITLPVMRSGFGNSKRSRLKHSMPYTMEKPAAGQPKPVVAADFPFPESGKESKFETRVADEYLPSGSLVVTVEDAGGFKVGDHIRIIKTTNEKWRSDLGMGERLRHIRGGRQGYKKPWPLRKLSHPRKIMDIQDNAITLDIVLPQSISKNYGGGTVRKVRAETSDHSGLEYLRIVSNYDASQTSRSKSANYRNLSSGIGVRGIDGWVRNCTVEHVTFAAATVGGRFNTVREVSYLNPVGPRRGGKMYPFQISGGALGNLVYKCYAEDGRHSFAVSARVQGPNAYVECTALRDGLSEPHHRWASGVLYDNIVLKEKGSLGAFNRGDSGSGHGWAGANILFWNCDASAISVFDPETAGENNFAIGYSGEQRDSYSKMVSYSNTRAGYWGTPLEGKYYGFAAQGNGYIESPEAPVEPRYLFRAQLAERIGREQAEKVLK